MSQTKYIMSGGLAFSEEKDLEKLRQYSLKGWHVCRFSFMGYTLEKGESTDFIYSIDNRTFATDEEDEYLELFSAAGWTQIDSDVGFYLFRATPGTKPIFSDRETVVEKHESLNQTMKQGALPLVYFTLLLWLGTFFTEGTLHMVLLVAAILLSPLALPLAWTALTVKGNVRKAKGNNVMHHGLKAAPLLFFVVAAVTFGWFTNDISKAFRLVASMLIGGFALPAGIWLVLTLSHKWRRQKA